MLFGTVSACKMRKEKLSCLFFKPCLIFCIFVIFVDIKTTKANSKSKPNNEKYKKHTHTHTLSPSLSLSHTHTLMNMASSSSLLLRRCAFAATAGTSLGCSAMIFKDLSDFSQWVNKPKRNNLMKTYRIRHELATATVAGVAGNTLSYWYGGMAGAMRMGLPGPKGGIALWAGINVASLGMLFLGYGNPELMMRSRNRNALYLTTCASQDLIKPNETVIVTKYGKDQFGDDAYFAFPEQQISRPHIGGIPRDERNVPAAIMYCALTGTGIVYETPDLPCGQEKFFFPLTQLENNLVVMERTTGHIGHQINGINETKLLERIGSDDYDDVGRRPSEAELEELQMEPAKEVASWKMPFQYYATTYPHGKVFINDYKEYPDLKRPVLTMYDKIMDAVFYVYIQVFHNNSEVQAFPTVDKVDDRLPTKTRVWGFNVGDHYIALTEDFVKEGKNGVRNMQCGDVPIVASWDDNVDSLGIWIRPSSKVITKKVDVRGRVDGKGDSLERVSTVKNGLWWYVWQNFFPSTDVNPEK